MIPSMPYNMTERVVRIALLSGPIFACSAVVCSIWSSTAIPGILLGAGGVTLVISLVLGFELDGIPTARERQVEPSIYEELRLWARLRTTSLFLSMLILFSTLVLIAGLFRRIGWIDAPVPAAAVHGSAIVFATAVIIAAALAQSQGLRMRIDRDRSDLNRLFVYSAALLGTFIVLLGAIVATRASGLGPLRASDGLFFLLTGLLIMAIGAFLARGLPTPISVYDAKDLRGYGPRQMTYTRSVVVPTLIAYVSLFLVVFIFIAYGFGARRLFHDAVGSGLSLGLILFLLLGLLSSIGGALFLMRSDRAPALIDKKHRWMRSTGTWIVGLSIMVGVPLLVGSYWVQQGVLATADPSAWIHLFSLGCLALVGPYGFYVAHRARRIRRIEERLPDFLRDVAGSHRGGLTLPESVQLAARGDYGVLSGEVQKMADQLSWNIPLDEVLRRFADRVPTPLVQRTVSLILEASASGGNSVHILLAVGKDARMIKSMESDRRLAMGMYAAVIHITFLVFLLVTAVLYGRFVPEIVAASEHMTASGSATAGAGFAPVSALAFRDFYYVAAVLQGIGNGLVAGVMGSGRWVLGLRHSFFMTGIAWFVFAFVL